MSLIYSWTRNRRKRLEKIPKFAFLPNKLQSFLTAPPERRFCKTFPLIKRLSKVKKLAQKCWTVKRSILCVLSFGELSLRLSQNDKTQAKQESIFHCRQESTRRQKIAEGGKKTFLSTLELCLETKWKKRKSGVTMLSRWREKA